MEPEEPSAGQGVRDGDRQEIARNGELAGFPAAVLEALRNGEGLGGHQGAAVRHKRGARQSHLGQSWPKRWRTSGCRDSGGSGGGGALRRGAPDYWLT